jgi:hypothetical protein
LLLLVVVLWLVVLVLRRRVPHVGHSCGCSTMDRGVWHCFLVVALLLLLLLFILLLLFHPIIVHNDPLFYRGWRLPLLHHGLHRRLLLLLLLFVRSRLLQLLLLLLLLLLLSLLSGWRRGRCRALLGLLCWPCCSLWLRLHRWCLLVRYRLYGYWRWQHYTSL